MKKLSKTETALKKRVAYEKNMYFKRTYMRMRGFELFYGICFM